MTIKEFSVKYDVPYHLVYASSYRVQPTATVLRDRDFPEDGLRDAVTALLKERVTFHRQIMEKDVQILERMGVSV